MSPEILSPTEDIRKKNLCKICVYKSVCVCMYIVQRHKGQESLFVSQSLTKNKATVLCQLTTTITTARSTFKKYTCRSQEFQ